VVEQQDVDEGLIKIPVVNPETLVKQISPNYKVICKNIEKYFM